MGVQSNTASGTWMGTPLYISPEQAQGHPGNERSDIYSLLKLSLAVMLLVSVMFISSFCSGFSLEKRGQTGGDQQCRLDQAESAVMMVGVYPTDAACSTHRRAHGTPRSSQK